MSQEENLQLESEELSISAVCAGIERFRNWAYGVAGAECDELLAEANLQAIIAIRNGVLVAHPDAYAHGILRHLLGKMISERCSARKHIDITRFPKLATKALNPEEILLAKEAEQRSLPTILEGSRKPADREILTRFYISRESPKLICEKMHLTPTQYRLNKSRAKSRLTQRISTPDRRAA